MMQQTMFDMTEKSNKLSEILPEKEHVNFGDVFMLGDKHILICGDSIDKKTIATIEKLFPGDMAELLFTSPPYFDLREYDANCDLSVSNLAKIFSVFMEKARYFVINLGLVYRDFEIVTYWNQWIESARSTGLKLLSWNVWDQIYASSIGRQSQMFALQHEWVFVFGEKPKKINRTWEKEWTTGGYIIDKKGRRCTKRRQKDGSIKYTTLGKEYEKKNMGTVFCGYSETLRKYTKYHPAIFPISLPKAYIEAMTNENDIVIDPFVGSGTTFLACESLNRKCVGIEIYPQYAECCIYRFKKETGKSVKKIM